MKCRCSEKCSGVRLLLLLFAAFIAKRYERTYGLIYFRLDPINSNDMNRSV